jgi:Asparagine synthase (glutamine-hydrolyzing)
MCGIVGIIDPLNTIENKKELITTINDTQNHRGPDEFWLL